ncbi:hypothetical protein KCP70_04500 [Salmonella enterica subsp. enterica]|nr:hypothetical protein KCP70_04500 [Salmonella enterica subsp. enterica]
MITGIQITAANTHLLKFLLAADSEKGEARRIVAKSALLKMKLWLSANWARLNNTVKFRWKLKRKYALKVSI